MAESGNGEPGAAGCLPLRAVCRRLPAAAARSALLPPAAGCHPERQRGICCPLLMVRLRETYARSLAAARDDTLPGRPRFLASGPALGITTWFAPFAPFGFARFGQALFGLATFGPRRSGLAPFRRSAASRFRCASTIRGVDGYAPL